MIQGDQERLSIMIFFWQAQSHQPNYFHCNKNEDDADDNGSDEEKLFDSELDKKKSEASQDYRNKILDYQSNNPQDNFDNK